MNGDLNPLTGPSDDAALEQVKAALRDNPHWLESDDELNTLMRRAGGNVIDMEAAAISRIERRARRVVDSHRKLRETARANLAIQSQIHAVVLSLMSAESLCEADERLTWMLPGALGVDCVRICVEGVAIEPLAAIRTGEDRLVRNTLGSTKWERLGLLGRGARLIYGEETDRLRSEAVVRLQVGEAPGLLALASRDSRTFQEENGTELLNFLARVLERRLQEWLFG